MRTGVCFCFPRGFAVLGLKLLIGGELELTMDQYRAIRIGSLDRFVKTYDIFAEKLEGEAVPSLSEIGSPPAFARKLRLGKQVRPP